MGLSLSCQSASNKKAGTQLTFPLRILAPETALGSHPCVALSSAQAEYILSHFKETLRVLFLHEETNLFRVLFYLRQRVRRFGKRPKWFNRI
jgi:hypothetical protein